MILSEVEIYTLTRAPKAGGTGGDNEDGNEEGGDGDKDAEEEGEEDALGDGGVRTGALQLAPSERERLLPPEFTLEELVALSKAPKPPLPIIVAFVCVQLLLNPVGVKDLPPVSKLRTRPLRRSLLRRPKQTLKQLQAFDPALPLPRRVLQLTWPILTSSKFGVSEVSS